MQERSHTLPTPRIFRHPDGITAVDTEYVHPGHAAAHIVQHGGRAAFVDVGTNDSVPYLLAALEVLGIARESVDYLLLTHVHLDHAGGAGRLMRELPNATAVLHPRGAPHMIDPAKLIAGSQLVYGKERFRALYGDIVPIAPERVRVTRDGDTMDLAGRELEILHTPGHALHHQVFVDRAHACIFTGDTFGLSYRELDAPRGAFIIPTTTPTQFDPGQLIASVDRLLSYSPEAMYLMHFSRVTDVPRLGESLKAQIRELRRIAEQSAAAPDPAAAIRAGMSGLWRELGERHGSRVSSERLLELLEGDLELNTQGLIAWLQRRRQA
ncbi:MAG TPA: MBL fold metallo-hydrolase [Steroidobacteraceae bacterium]|nr:MBL fold metallo-hydrolase [Steroidobacteraceae bacterium]